MKLLAIGNSFSQDALRYVHDMAAADGVEFTVANLYIGGCSLEQHYRLLDDPTPHYDFQINGQETGTPSTLSQGLTKEKWDIITLQQASGLSGIEKSFFPYLTALLERVKQTNPQARIALHQTWAYEIGSQHPDFVRYNGNQTTMADAIAKAYRKIAAATGIETVIPAGEVIRSLRSTPLFNVATGGLSLCRDGFHMSLDYGRFAVGACWYETLLNKDITQNTFLPPTEDPRDTTEQRCGMIRQKVHDLLHNH